MPARPAQGRSLRGAPPLPRLPGRAEAEPRGKESGGTRWDQTLGTPPSAAHVQPPSHAEFLPRSIAARRLYGTMHSPGSTGPGDARAVSDGAERGARRGTREGWRLLATVGAEAVLWSGRARGSSAGSWWGGGVLARQPAFSFVSCPLRPRPARLFPAMTSPESRGGPLLVVGAAGGNLGAGQGRSQSRGAAWGRGESG